LTREAVAIYLTHMAADGIIAVHISNKHFALEPVVLALADLYHLASVTINSGGTNTGEGSNSWVLLSPSQRVLHSKLIWNGKRQSRSRVLWTDDHASLFEVWLTALDDWFDTGRRKSKLHPGGIEMPDKPEGEEESDDQ